MKKLFSLTTEQFFDGIAGAAHEQDAGLFAKAVGINPFVNPFPESIDVGLLQTASAPVDITSSVVVDTILDGVAKITGSTTGNLYMLGTAGHLYNKDLANDNAPTDLRSGTPISNPANAIDIYKPQGGTEILLYWQTAQVGTWNLAGTYPTGWTDNAFTGLQSTTQHPRHQFRGNLYYGNKDRIGMFYGVAGTLTNNTNVLDLPADYVATCLNDDGTYLIAGITKNIDGFILKSETRIIFWDTINPDSWNHEWAFPDYTINAIRPWRSGFLAWGSRGIYFFSFYVKPTLILPIPTISSFVSMTDYLGDAVIWGGRGFALSTYGKLVPQAPDKYFQPFAGLGNFNTSYVNSSVRGNRIYAATAQPKLWYYDITTGGATNSTAPLETIYIDLKGRFNVKMIDIYLGEPLASGDVCTVKVQRDEDNAAITFGTMSFSSWGAARRIRLRNLYNADRLKTILDFSAGNVKIKRIDYYGDAIRS